MFFLADHFHAICDFCFPHDSGQEMDKKGQKRSRPASSGEKNPRPYKRQNQKLQDARKIAVQSSSPGYP